MFPICQKFQGLSVQLPNGQQGSCDDFMTQTKEESQTKNYPEWKIERDMIDHVIIDSKQVCQTAQIMLGHTPHDCTSRDISVCGGKTTENYLGCVARAGENAEAILSVGPNMKILYADDQRSMSGIHMGVQVPGLLYHDKYRVINVGIAAAGGGFDVSNSDNIC